MSLQERVYSVLIVSASEKFRDALLPILPEAAYSPVVTAGSVGEAERLRNEREFDFVFINSPLPDDAGIRFAIDCCRSGGTVADALRRCMSRFRPGRGSTGCSSCPGPSPETPSSGG